MRLAGKITTLHHKINAYKTQYHLGRETAKISAQSSGKLDKYEFSTDQDLPQNQEQWSKSNLSILRQVRILKNKQKNDKTIGFDTVFGEQKT